MPEELFAFHAHCTKQTHLYTCVSLLPLLRVFSSSSIQKFSLPWNHKRRMIHPVTLAKPSFSLLVICLTHKYLCGLFLKSSFSPLVCSVGMHLSWHLLLKAPPAKYAVFLGIMVFYATFPLQSSLPPAFVVQPWLLSFSSFLNPVTDLFRQFRWPAAFGSAF